MEDEETAVGCLPDAERYSWTQEGRSAYGASINAASRQRPPLVAGATTFARYSVGRQKESAFMGRLGALLRPLCTSYAGCAQWDYGCLAAVSI